MPRSKSSLATVPPVVDFGSPSSRLQKLIDATKKREPYELTDAIVVAPPTRKSRQRMDQLSYDVIRNQTLVEDAFRRADESAPELPGTPPEELAEDASDEDRTAHEDAVNAWESARADYEQSVKDWEARVTAAAEDIRTYSTKLQSDNLEWHKTLLGDTYDSVNEFLGEQEPELYEAVIADIRDHFQSDPEAPETGVCSHCGTVLDVDAAGKDTESSI